MTTPATPSSRIIAFMNQKGGVGKTTTTVNLGAALAEHGAKVLMVDLDPQAHMTLHVGVDPAEVDGSVYDLLVDPEVSAESVMVAVSEQMAVVPAEVDLAAAEQELGAMQDRHRVLAQKLRSVSDQYDFVLFDCPPSLGMLTLNALSMATEVIVPMQAHFLALQGLSKLLETVQLVRQNMNSQLRVSGVVLCVHDAQTNLATEVVADLEQFFIASRKLSMPWSNAVVYRPPIRRNIKLAECPSFGETILQYDPACAGAADYRKLGRVVMGLDPNPAPLVEAAEPEVEVAAEPDVNGDQAQARTPLTEGVAAEPAAEQDSPVEAPDAFDDEATHEIEVAEEVSSSSHEATTVADVVAGHDPDEIELEVEVGSEDVIVVENLNDDGAAPDHTPDRVADYADPAEALAALERVAIEHGAESDDAEADGAESGHLSDASGETATTPSVESGAPSSDLPPYMRHPYAELLESPLNTRVEIPPPSDEDGPPAPQKLDHSDEAPHADSHDDPTGDAESGHGGHAYHAADAEATESRT